MKRLFILILFLVMVDVGWGAASKLWSESKAASASSITIGPHDLNVGDLVVVSVSQAAGSVTLSSLTDNASTPNTYTSIHATSTAYRKIALFYSVITTAKSGASITATYSSGVAGLVQGIAFSGASSSPLDTHNNASAYSTTVSSSITTSENNEIIVYGVGSYASGSFSPSTNWTEELEYVYGSMGIYDYSNSAGTINLTVTKNATDGLELIIASFKLAAESTTTTTTSTTTSTTLRRLLFKAS